MRKSKKTMEKIGFHLLVQDDAENGKPGKFLREGALFATRGEAENFHSSSRALSSRAFRVVGVRMNIVPIEPLKSRSDREEVGGGTHR